MSILINDLFFSYDKEPILRDVNFTLSKGHIYGILGPNGSGKSTLMKIINGILTAPNSKIFIDNIPINKYKKKELARKISFVPQIYHIDYAFSVYDVVLMGRYPYLSKNQSYSSLDNSLVESALNATDTYFLRNKLISELSGGEVQRVLIARAIAQNTPFILLDEPISHLDIGHQYQIMELLKTLCQDYGKTIVTVLHDLNIALNYCDKSLLLKEGRLVEFGDTQNILNKENILKVYGVNMEIFINGNQSYLKVIL